MLFLRLFSCRKKRTLPLAAAGWLVFFAEKKTIETFFARRMISAAWWVSLAALGGTRELEAIAFLLIPIKVILYIQTKVIDQDQGDEENIL